MNDIAQREEREAVTPDLWQSVPFDCILCGAFIFAAAALERAGVLP